MSPATQVVVGGALGLACGVLLGDLCAVLHPLGQAYVMLLEVAVYPYLITSLLHGLGSLAPTTAVRLFRAAWPLYLTVWGTALAAILLLTTAIPSPPAPAVMDPSQAAPAPRLDLLDLLIPADLFTALSQNYVPAVVLFCLFYGVAIQTVPGKEAMLGLLDMIRQASLRFWNWIVNLAPVAVFALFAYTAGTTQLADLENLALYLVLFGVGCLVLALGLLPGLMAAVAPVTARRVLGDLQGALMISLVTTLSVSALPFVMEATRKIAEETGVDDPERLDLMRTNLSIAYVMGQLGNFFVLLFLVFAAWYYNQPLSDADRLALPVLTVLAGLGSPTAAVNSVTSLASWLGLPPGATDLFVELMTLTRYPQVLASVMGFAFLSITATLAYYGRVRVRPGRVLAVLGAGFVVLGGFSLGVRVFGPVRTDRGGVAYSSATLDPMSVQRVRAVVQRTPSREGDPAEPPLQRIRRTGVLRVGYNPGVLPFCYFNERNELVGYDVAMAYDLAHHLNARLELVPFLWEGLEDDLRAHRFEIAMAGIYVTEDRLRDLSVSQPCFQSPLALVVRSERAGEFLDRSSILEMKDLSVAVFDDPVLLPLLRSTLPNARVVVVPSYAPPPDFAQVDAAIWTLEQAGAMAEMNPGLTAVAPRDLGSPFLFAYMMPPGATGLRGFVNYWLQLSKAEGLQPREAAYWLEGRPRADRPPRWSVLRNVLGIDGSLGGRP